MRYKVSSTLPAFFGGFLGWWLSDKFLGFSWVPGFPKDGTAIMVLICTGYLLMGLDELRRAITRP